MGITTISSYLYDRDGNDGNAILSLTLAGPPTKIMWWWPCFLFSNHGGTRMEWVNNYHRLPIKSWCKNIEQGSLDQAMDLANHPALSQWVALMPDCHRGYGMPIGGVIICPNHIIPNGVGVDIGCGVRFARSETKNEMDKSIIRRLLNTAKELIPVGEGHSHKEMQKWDMFDEYIMNTTVASRTRTWIETLNTWKLAQYNLGTLGGGK